MVRLTKCGHALQIQPVRAAVVAMVGHEDHQRIVRLPRRVQCIQHLAQQRVFQRAEGPVVCNGLAHLVFRKLVPQLPPLALHDAGLVLQRIVKTGRQFDIVRVVHVHELLRHIERIVRADRSHKQTPRCVLLG